MAESNTEVVTLLQNLSEKFNSLYKDVEVLKEKDACRSASNTSTSELETSNIEENHTI